MTLSTLERVERYRRDRAYHDYKNHMERVAMALKPGVHMGVPLTSTGRKSKLKNARMVDGKLEIDKPKAKLPRNVQYAKANRKKYRGVAK